MGQVVMEIILDEKAFQFLLCHTKQAKPKYWAGTMPALLCGMPALSSQRKLEKGLWDNTSDGGIPSLTKEA